MSLSIENEDPISVSALDVISDRTKAKWAAGSPSDARLDYRELH
jgi:hypothetical protein